MEREQPTFNPRRPFTRAQADEAGISLRQLRGPNFRRIFHGIYISTAVMVTTQVRAVAALSIAPAGAHASHSTAALLWGGCVPDDPEVHISVPKRSRRVRRRGVRAHLAPAAVDVSTVSGVAVTSATRAFLDMSAELSLVDLVVLGDSLVKAGRFTPAELGRAAAAWQGRHACAARRAARLVRAEVDSPMESRLRMLIVLAGLPEPRINHIVRDAEGQWMTRFDLSYPNHRVVIEYDGRQHAENDRQWGRDIERREDLDRDHWRLIVVRAPDVYRHPVQTLRRITAALREHGMPVPAVLDHPGDEWCRLFPTKG